MNVCCVKSSRCDTGDEIINDAVLPSGDHARVDAVCATNWCLTRRRVPWHLPPTGTTTDDYKPTPLTSRDSRDIQLQQVVNVLLHRGP